MSFYPDRGFPLFKKAALIDIKPRVNFISKSLISPTGKIIPQGPMIPGRRADELLHALVVTPGNIVLDEKGAPSDVLIPYDQFAELSETYEWDLNEQEQKDLSEALADSKAGNREAFVPASEV